MAWPRKFGVFALTAGAALVIGSNIYRFAQNEQIQPARDDLISVLPDAARFTRETEPVPYYRGFYSDGKLAGAAFLTSQVPPRLPGFSAEIDLLVGLSPEGIISRVEIIRHRETPAYLRMIIDSGLLDLFAGLELLSGPPEIEAVSGATISSRAIIDDVTSAASLVARRAFGLEVPPPQVTARKPFWYLDILLVGFLFLFALWGRSRLRWARFISLLLGFLVIGLYLNTPLALNHLVNLLSLHPPSVFQHPGLFALLFLTLAGALLFGNIYCSHLCPFAALIEAGAALVPGRIRVSPSRQKTAAALRPAVLFFALAGIFGFGINSLAYLEPYPYLFAFTATRFLWLYILAALGFSLVFRRLWCRMLCPTGAFLDLLARIKIRRVPGPGRETSPFPEEKPPC